MQARTRTMLFVLVVVLFVVIAPLLVLYAKGYSFKPASREVVRTGMILIDTNVPKVAVTITRTDDPKSATTLAEPNVENDPVILRSLVPGTYHVTLERDGYEPWSADLAVEIEKVTRVDDVLLTLSQPKSQQPIKNTIGQFAVSPNSRFIAYAVTEGKDAGIWMHTNGDELNRQLVSPTDTTQSVITPSKIDSITWSQNSRLLLLHGSDGRYWHISPHVSTPIATELTSLKDIPREQVLLDQDEPTIVYFTDSKQRLFRWRTGRQDSAPEQLATNVAAFSVATPKVFTLTQSTTGNGLELQSYDVREATPQPSDVATVAGSANSSQTSGGSSIVSASGSLVAVLQDKTLWLLKRTNGAFGFTKIADGVDQAKWSPKGTLLMYQHGLELWVHDLDPLTDEPADYSFATMSQSPTRVAWHPAGAYAVITYDRSGTMQVDLAHISRTAPQTKTIASLDTSEIPQFARGGLDLVYKASKSAQQVAGLVLLTIAQELD